MGPPCPEAGPQGLGWHDLADLRAVYVIWYREMLRLRRDRVRLIGQLVSPLLFLVVFGVGLTRAMGMFAGGTNFTQFLFPGLLGMTVLLSAFTSGVSVVWEREIGFLKEVLVAPVSRASIVIGKTLGGATLALTQGALMLALAPLLGIRLSPGLVLGLLPLMFLLAGSLGAMGVLLASRMRTMEGFFVINQMVVMPMVFLSGVFFPVGRELPAWLGVVVRINPVAYGVDSVRQLMLGGTTPALTLFGHPMTIWQDAGVVALFGLLMVGLAIRAFNRAE